MINNEICYKHIKACYELYQFRKCITPYSSWVEFRDTTKSMIHSCYSTLYSNKDDMEYCVDLTMDFFDNDYVTVVLSGNNRRTIESLEQLIEHLNPTFEPLA